MGSALTGASPGWAEAAQQLVKRVTWDLGSEAVEFRALDPTDSMAAAKMRNDVVDLWHRRTAEEAVYAILVLIDSAVTGLPAMQAQRPVPTSETIGRAIECALQKQNLLNSQIERPPTPQAKPMESFRGQPMTHETAENILVGHFNPNNHRHSWLVAAGSNPAYEQFALQCPCSSVGVARKAGLSYRGCLVLTPEGEMPGPEHAEAHPGSVQRAASTCHGLALRANTEL
eukprot:Skav223443  [mRNA]  locus=scaffold350:717820:724996:+ [translate_table: standard]